MLSYAAALVPFKALMFILAGVLLGRDLCSLASAKQCYPALIFKHTTSASAWKQKLEGVIKLRK